MVSEQSTKLSNGLPNRLNKLLEPIGKPFQMDE